MNIEIPEFLIEMSKHIRAQERMYIDDTFYHVVCRRYLVTKEDYNVSHWELVGPHSEGREIYSSNNPSCYDDELYDFYDENEEWCNDWLEVFGRSGKKEFIDLFSFHEHYESGLEWPEGYEVLHMQEVEEVILTCLTKEDADYFIQHNQSQYPELYTNKSSMRFCPEMTQLRRWILNLTN